MLSYTDLKKGVLFLKDGEVFEVLEANFSRMQQRKAVVQAKIRKIISGKILDITFQPSDSFEEVELERRPMTFLYQHRAEYVFTDPKNKGNRLTLKEETIGDKKIWLKPNIEVICLFYGEKMITLTLPIKIS